MDLRLSQNAGDFAYRCAAEPRQSHRQRGFEACLLPPQHQDHKTRGGAVFPESSAHWPISATRGPTKNHGVLAIGSPPRPAPGLADRIGRPQGQDERPHTSNLRGRPCAAASGRLLQARDGQAPKTMGPPLPRSCGSPEIQNYMFSGLHRHRSSTICITARP
jgi:hypothetical protein